MSLRVESSALTNRLFQLLIYDGQTLIGEYERSQAADVQRKKQEIHNASALLRAIYAAHGPFVVRWTRAAYEKQIRVAGSRVDAVPKDCWEKASWE